MKKLLLISIFLSLILGSKVIFAESLFKPIINLFSSIGFHPKVSIKPFKTLRTEQSPS